MEKIPIITMFLKNSGGISSKRVCGILAWMICLIIFILGFALGKEIPDFADLLLTVSAGLLGLDSVAGIFNKSVSK